MLQIIITEDESDLRATMLIPNVAMGKMIAAITAVNTAAKE